MAQGQRPAEEYIRYFKVSPCPKRQQHDWTCCFNSHPGEKARRRDLQTHAYAAVMCADMLHKGSCDRGDACPMAHNVFEYHMHPDKFRTKLCTSGANCQRNFCFFAHSHKELRRPGASTHSSSGSAAQASPASQNDTNKANTDAAGAQQAPSSAVANVSQVSNSGQRQQGFLDLSHLMCSTGYDNGSSSRRSSFDMAPLSMAVSPLSALSSNGSPIAAVLTNAAFGAPLPCVADVSSLQLGSLDAAAAAAALQQQQQQVARLLRLDLEATAIAATQEVAKLQLELNRRKQEEASAALSMTATSCALQRALASLQSPAEAAAAAVWQAAGMMTPASSASTPAGLLDAAANQVAQYSLGCQNPVTGVSGSAVLPSSSVVPAGAASLLDSASSMHLTPAEQQQLLLLGVSNTGVSSMLPFTRDAMLQLLQQQLQLNAASAGSASFGRHAASVNAGMMDVASINAQSSAPAFPLSPVVAAALGVGAGKNINNELSAFAADALKQYSYFG